jgi:hypothetical protein
VERVGHVAVDEWMTIWEMDHMDQEGGKIDRC